MTPQYIINNWTDEEFTLMVEKMNKRKQREIDAIQSRGDESDAVVSDKELFSELGNRIKIGG